MYKAIWDMFFFFFSGCLNGLWVKKPISARFCCLLSRPLWWVAESPFCTVEQHVCIVVYRFVECFTIVIKYKTSINVRTVNIYQHIVQCIHSFSERSLVTQVLQHYTFVSTFTGALSLVISLSRNGRSI